jgi:predicted phage terminase large subunit-like protein
MAADPGYRANLWRYRMWNEKTARGNWKVRPSAGLYFQRRWCKAVDMVPAGTRYVRGWDLAGTIKTESNDPDWTAGTKIGRMPDGRFVVAHHLRLRGTPMEVERSLLSIASHDSRNVRIAIPEDPGQAGKSQAQQLLRLLAGYEVRIRRVTGDKATRFGAFSAQAEAGNVDILRGDWNDSWFTALEAFPESAHDDDVDATSEAFNL